MQRPAGFPEPVWVTRPMLPPLGDYVGLLQEIWDSGWLTNGGLQHRKLEAALAEYLEAPNLSLFNNGTLALIVACQALRVAGEVITTPFTFPATPHVLSWNNVTPVFADIDPDRMTLDPGSVEAMISNRTSAILAVHVYGVPCDVTGLARLAETYGLKLIYDGAHAFGTRIDGRAITSFGDATMLSFHATKLFHTAEGGALVVRDPALKRRIDLLKNFGIKNEEQVMTPGINGKMNELQAALGRINLRHIDAEHASREAIIAVYAARLAHLPGVRFVRPPAGTTDSCQYAVVRIDAAMAGCSRDALHEALKPFNIMTRKYFYPLCSDYSCYQMLPSADPRRLPVARQVAREVLSLPLFGALGLDGAHRVCDAVAWVLSER